MKNSTLLLILGALGVLILVLSIGVIGVIIYFKPDPLPVPPTATPKETAVTQTSTPYPAPTATPYGEPEFVGLNWQEVKRLREKCLEENPDSLCLPLPVNSIGPGFKIEEARTGDAQDHRFLRIYVPSGTTVVSPLSLKSSRYGVYFRIFGDRIPASLGWSISREPEWADLEVRVGFAQKSPWHVRLGGDGVPELINREGQSDDIPSYLDCPLLTINTGNPVLKIIGDNFLLRYTYTTSVDGDPNNVDIVGPAMGDLLRDEQGKIVYPLPYEVSP